MFKVCLCNATYRLQIRWSTVFSPKFKFTLILCLIPDLCYNIALCYYKLKQYSASLKYITEIIERGIKEHQKKLKVKWKSDMKFFKPNRYVQSLMRHDSVMKIAMEARGGISVKAVQLWNDSINYFNVECVTISQVLQLVLNGCFQIERFYESSVLKQLQRQGVRMRS